MFTCRGHLAPSSGVMFVEIFSIIFGFFFFFNLDHKRPLVISNSRQAPGGFQMEMQAKDVWSQAAAAAAPLGV